MHSALKWAVLGAWLVGCAPAHLKTVSLSRGGRDLPEVFLGGWDGRRLGGFDDRVVEFEVSPAALAASVLGALASERYAAVYVERSRLDPQLVEAHGLFCETPMCLVVLERGAAGWGRTLAVFELTGAQGTVGRVWLAGRGIRPPGPERWPLMCHDPALPPRHVHPDGGALYPARLAGGEAFALFGPREEPARYLSGYRPPSRQSCDEAYRHKDEEPDPERPIIEVDPNILPAGVEIPL